MSQYLKIPFISKFKIRFYELLYALFIWVKPQYKCFVIVLIARNFYFVTLIWSCYLLLNTIINTVITYSMVAFKLQFLLIYFQLTSLTNWLVYLYLIIYD